jgi:hypothetical protein
MSFQVKTCSKCKATKPASAFYFCGLTKDQMHSQCKECMKEWSKEQYRLKKEKAKGVSV